MDMNKKIIAIILGFTMLIGCSDVFEPAIENILEKDFMYKDATFASGLLLNAYARMPSNGWRHSDAATDNAVSNAINDDHAVIGYRRIANGQWSNVFNPMDEWRNSRSAIQYINMLINDTDKINWALDEEARQLYADRFKGEAHGLRAYFMLYLMQHHAGIGTSGELLGVPIVTEFEEATANFNLPRNSFEECMQMIYNDLEMAMSLLPVDYAVPAASDELYINKYQEMGISSSAFERVFGAHGHGKMNRRIAEAIMARAKLFAASPAYISGSTTTWEQAANAAGALLQRIGGVSGLAPTGHTWFANNSEINGLGAGQNPREVIWRTALGVNRTLEQEFFPPMLYGRGRINPTQNLVDAFPMANGYPIGHPNSGYNPANPYVLRDPRLALFIVINNSTMGVGNQLVITAADGPNNNALNRVETSTRTGYYMRKLLRMDVNLDPNAITDRRHYRPHFRYTEIFLNYAEAANEAWGPEGTGAFGFSAYDVIKAIRVRAKVGGANDAYLESIRGDQAQMRELIRNERRLELSFEDFRFWDLRRWKIDITEAALGVRIEGGVHTIITVETRPYQSHMYYGPIPNSEILKYNALEQNQGW
jgi:starch-binding outer membrane protein, SusD/RagB family